MFKAIAASSLLASAAVAQVASPLQIAQLALNFLSSDCQQTVLQLANSSNPVYQCLQIDSLIPALTTNESLIAPVDSYLSSVCYNSPCNSTLLNSTATAVIEGCSTDLAKYGVSNETVYDIMGLYPLARDVVCLKNNETEVLSNATVSVNSTAYNSTNGTFCFTELAANLTGYLGVNLTNAYVDTIALGGNASALQMIEMLPPTALCSDCIFGAVDIIEEAYPEFGRLIISKQNDMNVTINDALDGLCMAEGLNVTMPMNGTMSMNGTNTTDLPEGIIEVAKNGSETTTVYPSITGNPFGLEYAPASASVTPVSDVTVSMPMPTMSMMSLPTEPVMSLSMPAASMVSASAASAAPSLAGRMAEKRRWIGQA